MKKDFAYYANKFRKLNVDRAHGTAPYQPLLLLALIELIEQGIVRENRFLVSPELISIFIQYRDQLSLAKFRADPAQPFYHLSRPRGAFWHLMARPGHEVVLASKAKLNTLGKLRDNVQYGYFDHELFELLQNKITRNTLISLILNEWFPDKIQQIQNLFQVNSFERLRLALRESGGAVYSVEEIKRSDEADLIVRDAAFRRNLVSFYDRHCAFCRLRIVSDNNENIIDGAHIKPFSEFRDDRYTNGLALCKNHHWAFDRGWFSIDDHYRIVVAADRFKEDPPVDSRAMREFHGEEIYLPDDEGFYPSPESLQWHRQHWQIAG